MSLAAQEQALFDLIFDDGLRARFGRDGVAALDGRGLDASERAAFASVRVDALEHDARLRRAMVLSQLCAALPLTTALAGCVDGALADFDALVDSETMRTPLIERSYVFARRLRARWDGMGAQGDAQDDARDYADALPGGGPPPASQTSGAAVADDERSQRESAAALWSVLVVVLEAELGMAFTAASLCRETIDLGRPPAAAVPVAPDWRTRPARVAPFVSAALLPASYGALRQALCTAPDREMHRLAARGGIDAERVHELLAEGTPRLLVARAAIDRGSKCDPTARHVTVELSEGFADLVGHADGAHSIDDLLAALRDSGADDTLLAGVAGGFGQLFEAGVLELCA